MNNLSEYSKIHLIGVFGASMSGLAKYLVLAGKKVSGSDLNPGPAMQELKALGADVYVGSNAQKATFADLVVVSSAVPNTDPEIMAAKARGIEIVSRGQLLGAITRCFDTVIAVAGTHGKSTTTAMIGKILQKAGKDAFVHVGVSGYNTNNGDSSICVVEACEYRQNFLHLSPSVAVVLNAEPDHPDCFPDKAGVMQAFGNFAGRIRADGTLIKGMDLDIAVARNTVEIGRDVLATEIVNEEGKFSFVPVIFGNKLPRVRLRTCGQHNLTNACFALTAAILVGVDANIATDALSEFQGIPRRMDTVGSLRDADVIVDYAHHPTAIRAAIGTARQMTKGALTVIFQPHTYSRTKALFDEFVSALTTGGVVIILKEYAARETPDQGKSAYDLYTALKGHGVRVRYATTTREATEVAARYAYPGDIILALGAGNLGEEIHNFCTKSRKGGHTTTKKQ